MGWPEIITVGTVPSVGSVVIPLDLESNVIDLHEFLFPELEYEPSSTVISNSYEIYSRTSNYSSGSLNTNTAYETNSENSITNVLLAEIEEADDETTEDEMVDDIDVEIEADTSINYEKFNNPVLEFNDD